MNPIRVFFSIFAVGIVLTLILGAIGFSLDLEGDQMAEGDTGETTETLNVPASMKSCISCHGTDLRGVATAPSLRDLGHLTDAEILDIITNGKGTMPGGMAAGKEEEVLDYLLSIQDN